MSLSSKKVRHQQKPMQNALLDEIRVIKNIVDFRISAVESKIDLLISTCSSILNNSEIMKSREKGSISCLNTFTERLLLRLKDIETLMTTLGFCVNNQMVNNQTMNSQSCKNCSSNRSRTMSNKSEIVLPTTDDLKLNSAEDIPEGSWLGYESDPQSRVRVNIDPAVLLHINDQCTSPEKMALALIDALFPRDVLAISNLSGKGLHCKQQLDPLLIYGVKCHLKYKFNITDVHWERIKRNIDSKCRTIWRRKKRGLPVGSNRADCKLKPSHSDFNEFESSDECTDSVICYKVDKSQKVTDDISPDEDIQLPIVKQTTDDFHLLPSVQLFTMEAADCFMLQGHELVIPQEIIKDVSKHSDFSQ